MILFQERKMNPILVHINYFEQGQTLEHACRMVSESGADGIEFRRKPRTYTGSDLDYIDEVSSALDKHPLSWVSFGTPGVNLMQPDPDACERELDAAEAFYRKAAERFPLRIVNAFAGTLPHPDKTLPGHEYWHHGSTLATEKQWESAITGFRRLGSLASELGFRFAFETHGVYLHDTLESTLRLVNGIDSDHVGLLWDHCNLMLFPQVPTLEEVIRESGKNLFYVHFKNLLIPPTRFLAVSSLSGGILNIREQLSMLLQAGYDGPFCIESPRPGDREHFFHEDLTYFRQLQENLEHLRQSPPGQR